MQGNRDRVDRPTFAYAHYPKRTFTTIPDGIIGALTEKQVGRNGWAVMAVLCKMVHADGRLGTVSAESIAEQSRLTLPQVARGMRDLRQRGVIAPVVLKNRRGYRHPDKSCHGHVAQYCVCKDVWSQVTRQENTRL